MLFFQFFILFDDKIPLVEHTKTTQMIENNLMRSIERHEKQVTTRVAAMMVTNLNRKMAVSDAYDRKLTARGIDEHAHARG